MVGDVVDLDQQRGRVVVAGDRLAEHDELLVVGGESRPWLLRPATISASCWASEAFGVFDLGAEFARFFALRAQRQHPEARPPARRRRACATIAVRCSAEFHSASPPIRSRSSRSARSPDARSSRSPIFAGSGGVAGARPILRHPALGHGRGVEGDGDVELGDEVAGAAVGPELPVEARSLAATSSLVCSSSPSSEDSTPTRVTPSMSFSAVTKPATASCPFAQPFELQRRPGASRRAGSQEPPDPRSRPTAAARPSQFRLVSQTSLGRTSESSRITRSQSKRLSARLCTVATRCSLRSRNCV